jgi:Spy/CpxP family protein refolding chaperone
MTMKRVAMIAAIAFMAAIAGVFIARHLVTPAPAPGAELHAVLHGQLSLDATQNRQLHALEESFAIRRQSLEVELRAHNARLARAIAAEHDNGRLVAAAVDASHATMGRLQKETLAHIFAMRRILRPEQATKFDQAVTKALTEDAR